MNGVPITIEVDGEHGTEHCVQPITTDAAPNPYSLLGEPGADELLPMVPNPVDGRMVTVIPLFAHYPEFLPEDGDVHAHAPPPDHDDEGGEPCDPLVIPLEGEEPFSYGTFVSEVELERLNLARSPEGVLARHLAEVEALLAGHRPGARDARSGRPTRVRLHRDRCDAEAPGGARVVARDGVDPGSRAWPEYPFPFGLVHEDFEAWDTWELSAFVLGGAASKFGSINVDAVAYHDRIMRIADDWLAGDPDGWPPQVHEFAATGERFVDYSGVRYSRAATYPGCVTYLDPATWREGYKVRALADVVDFADPAPNTGADGVLANVAGYAQMADDARAVILFIHNYDSVIAYADPVGLASWATCERTADELNDPGPDPDGEAYRLSGANRYETAVAVSADLYGAAEAEAVVLARGDDFADALAGAPLAAAVDAPLLLTRTAALHPASATELVRVLPEAGTIYVLGGPAAVSGDVVEELEALGYEVERIAGANRYETAVAIAGELGDPDTVLVTTGTDYPDAPAVVGVAREDDFPDALAGSAHVGRLGGPLVLSRTDALSPLVSGYLCTNNESVLGAYTYGGKVAIAPSALDALEARIRGWGC